MKIPKVLLISSVVLFALIGGVAVFKKTKSAPSTVQVQPAPAQLAKPLKSPPPVIVQEPVIEKPVVQPVAITPTQAPVKSATPAIPAVDRIHQLFETGDTKLPIVETITYTSRVAWLKGRPAWIADYASYYDTSRHFIARSLNGKSDYFTQKVSQGSKFNVFRKDKHINFHLIINLATCKMDFYYLDLDANERVLLKTYLVGLGRLDASKPSGTLTPLGIYSLGEKVAIYKPGVVGYFQDQKQEMVSIFGTRWIPFDKEIQGTTAPSKGYGIHGAPWVEGKSGQYIEHRGCIGKYESDGCVRLAMEDMEEIFSIVITRPTFVWIVQQNQDVKLPGIPK